MLVIHFVVLYNAKFFIIVLKDCASTYISPTRSLIGSVYILTRWSPRSLIGSVYILTRWLPHSLIGSTCMCILMRWLPHSLIGSMCILTRWLSRRGPGRRTCTALSVHSSCSDRCTSAGWSTPERGWIRCSSRDCRRCSLHDCCSESQTAWVGGRDGRDGGVKSQ